MACSSSPVQGPELSLSQAALVQYHSQHYPAQQIVKLLTTCMPLSHMEVAIRGKTSAGGDYFSRYNCAGDASQLRQLAAARKATEIHFGAFYADSATREHCTLHPPVGKPFVIDLDLQDCPATAHFKVPKENLQKCDRFLPLVLLGVEALKAALHDAFGFVHFACFYSGRRGVHMWVLDQRAFMLSPEARSAVTAALTAGGQGLPLYKFPSFARAVDVLFAGFGCLPLLEDDDYASEFVACIGLQQKVDRLRVGARKQFAELRNEVFGRDSASERWKHIQKRVDETGEEWIKERLRRLVVGQTWPKLDAAVSATTEHLTKSPFAVHSSTGRICVALPSPATAFDARTCPTVLDTRGLQKAVARIPGTAARPDPMDVEDTVL